VKRTILCAAALGLVLFGGSVGAHPQASPAAAAEAAPPDAMTYAAKAGASDLYEIQSSQLAEQKAATSAVRQFGQMMIKHHTMTTAQVTKAARAAGLNPPPPVLEPEQAAMIDELRGLSGAAFDAAYVRQQRLAHDRALALHSGYADHGDARPLQAAASSAVPVIRRHIDQLRSLPSS
jgi:putative membrane protein